MIQVSAQIGKNPNVHSNFASLLSTLGAVISDYHYACCAQEMSFKFIHITCRSNRSSSLSDASLSTFQWVYLPNQSIYLATLLMSQYGIGISTARLSIYLRHSCVYLPMSLRTYPANFSTHLSVSLSLYLPIDLCSYLSSDHLSSNFGSNFPTHIFLPEFSIRLLVWLSIYLSRRTVYPSI